GCEAITVFVTSVVTVTDTVTVTPSLACPTEPSSSEYETIEWCSDDLDGEYEWCSDSAAYATV
ncbi:hypothetical protein LPJ75_002335, partial [Coemansia sp. RSA 2598]